MAKSKKEYTVYNRQQEYDQTIAPVVEQLLKACNRANIPVFVTACISNEHGRSEYRSKMLSASALGLELYSDTFVNHACVMRGFTTVPPSSVTEIEYETTDEDTQT